MPTDTPGSNLAVTALDYVLGGNCIFTLVSVKTGVRFTYRVRKAGKDTPHFVAVLVGANNTDDYAFIGSIFGGVAFRHGKRSSIKESAPSVTAFDWFWRQLLKHRTVPAGCEFLPSSQCCCCGRALTTPESIAQGIGPDCLSRLGTQA